MTIQQAADAVDARLAEDQDPEDAQGTPPEQAPPAAPAVPASSKPPVDVRQLQKHATQSLQKWGVVADALGLEKDTPVDVLRAHLEERLEAASRGAGEDEEVDPAAIRRIRSLENREWKAEESIYGEMAIHAPILLREGQGEEGHGTRGPDGRVRCGGAGIRRLAGPARSRRGARGRRGTTGPVPTGGAHRPTNDGPAEVRAGHGPTRARTGAAGLPAEPASGAPTLKG